MNNYLQSVNTKKVNEEKVYFNVQKELESHGWMPQVDALQAEKLLTGKPAYTYLIRPCDFKRGFAISFVQKNGYVKHDHFTLINPMYGIWRNCGPLHIGKLSKVLRDMMHCSAEEGQPLL